MTSRLDFLRNERRVSVRLAIEQRVLARYVVTAARRHETLDDNTLTLIDREIDGIFNTWYPRFHGDLDCRYGRLILEETRTSWGIPLARTLSMLQKRIPAPVWRAINDEAA